MKMVLSGNQAIARGAWEAGVHVAVAYPGTPSTEILQHCGQYPEMKAQWSVNEKVALEVAGGSSIAGARTLCAMKHVGLNVAADPFFTLSYTGVNGGLVVISADDPAMHSSQNEQDNRHYARAAKVPMIEPSSSEEAHGYIQQAFELSETFDTPVLFRVTTRICHAEGVVEEGERNEVEIKPYEKDYQKYVMLPVNARGRHPLVEERMAKLLTLGKKSELNRIEKRSKSIGFITSGISYQYVREAFPDASILKYGLTNPLNIDLAKKFRMSVDKLYVVEEGDGFLEEQIKAAGIKINGGKNKTGYLGELSVEAVRAAFGKRPKKHLESDVTPPARPPALCPGCSHRGTFTALQKEKATVFGDIGCYTLAALPPLSMMETCICMGASVSASSGFTKARSGTEERKMACAIGDSTFIHSGITGLVDAVHNKTPFVTVILDNRVTAMTGHQNNPNTGLNLRGEETHRVDLVAMAKACGVRHVDKVNAWDVEAVREVLQRHWEYDEPSVVISEGECVVWAKKRETQYTIDDALCVGCKACVKIGCPAVIHDAGRRKSAIDNDLCVGCSLCFQQCRFDAIYRVDEEVEHRKKAKKILKERESKRAKAKKSLTKAKKGGRK